MSFIVIFYVLRYQGDIYILSALDRETKDRYTLTAYARDNPGGSLNKPQGKLCAGTWNVDVDHSKKN